MRIVGQIRPKLATSEEHRLRDPQYQLKIYKKACEDVWPWSRILQITFSRLITIVRVKGVSELADICVNIDGQPKSIAEATPSSERLTGIPMATEIDQLYNATLKTIDRVCTNIPFENYEQCSLALSRALSGVLAFQDPAIQPCMIRVQAWSDGCGESRKRKERRLGVTRINDDGMVVQEQAGIDVKPASALESISGLGTQVGTSSLTESTDVVDTHAPFCTPTRPDNEDDKLSDATPALPGSAGQVTSLTATASGHGGVYIALGSNVGDRIEAIEAACRAIDHDEQMKILHVSPLYETAPMYVEAQGAFLNGVCEVSIFSCMLF